MFPRLAFVGLLLTVALLAVAAAADRPVRCSALQSHAACAAAGAHFDGAPRCAWCGNATFAPPAAFCFDPRREGKGGAACCAAETHDFPHYWPGCEIPNASLCAAKTHHCLRGRIQVNPFGACPSEGCICPAVACCNASSKLFPYGPAGEMCYDPAWYFQCGSHDNPVVAPLLCGKGTACNFPDTNAAICCPAGVVGCEAPDGDGAWCCTPEFPICDSDGFTCTAANATKAQ